MVTNVKVKIPDSLHNVVGEIVKREGMSLEQFVCLAMAEKASALTTESYLEERAKRGSKAKFLAAMANVPDVEPPDARDRIPDHILSTLTYS